MTGDERERLERRVDDAAEAALAERKPVTTIDVLVGIRWLPARRVDEWRQGRVECLEEALHVDPRKLSAAASLFRRWAERRGLSPNESSYVARTRDRRALRFSKSGDPDVERAEAAGASGGRHARVRWIRRRSRSRWWHPCGTRTRATTSC